MFEEEARVVQMQPVEKVASALSGPVGSSNRECPLIPNEGKANCMGQCGIWTIQCINVY